MSKDNPEPVLKNAKQGSPEEKEERVYAVPFASKGNAVQLQVANSSSRAAKGLEIEIKDIPEWIELSPSLFTLGDLLPDKNATASFSFNVDKEAPLDKKVTLRFVAKNASGYHWEKEISLIIEPPTKVKLKQNYPNPFNPSTTITYELPAQMKVRVTVFNVLGQRIVTLVNEVQRAGNQEIQWDASRFASGLYFYRIAADAPGIKKIIQHKKMMLIK